MVSLNKMSGQYWWCLEHSSDVCRLACFIYSKRELVLKDTYTGTLKDCRQFMVQHKGSMDGILVADHSIPVRLMSGSDYALQNGDSAAPFLPGIAWSDMYVVHGLSPEEPVALCQSKSREMLDRLASHGFSVSRVVPVSMLHTAMMDVDTSIQVEAYVKKTDRFRDIWIFHTGEIKGYYRLFGDDHSVDRFFQDFLPRRFPGAEAPVIKEAVFQYPGIPTDFSTLAFLARETFEQDMALLSTLGDRNDEIASERRKDASVLRKIAKISAGVSAFAMTLLILSWVICTGYGLYTHSDRAEYAKRVEIDNELQTMSQNLEHQRDAMADLLRHRTRHASKMSYLIEQLPPRLWLTRWEVQGGRYTFQGLADDGNAISKLLSTLEKSPHFRQVRLRTTEKTSWQGRPVVRFDMAMEERE